MGTTILNLYSKTYKRNWWIQDASDKCQDNRVPVC